MQNIRELYHSPNGDRWHLARDPDTGRVFVKHQANLPSGGHMAEIEIGVFLNQRPRSGASRVTAAHRYIVGRSAAQERSVSIVTAAAILTVNYYGPLTIPDARGESNASGSEFSRSPRVTRRPAPDARSGSGRDDGVRQEKTALIRRWLLIWGTS